MTGNKLILTIDLDRPHELSKEFLAELHAALTAQLEDTDLCVSRVDLEYSDTNTTISSKRGEL